MTELKPTTIWISREELKEAKAKAAERDESLSSFVRKILRKQPHLPDN